MAPIERPPPTHPELFKVDYQEGSYMSALLAVRDFPAGSVIAEINGTTPGPKAYTSVQRSKDEHFELNSDLVFMNHSCDPVCEVSTDKMTVSARRDIRAGSPLTFFYPSTEYEMDQPFECFCKAPNCLGTVKGAKHISLSELQSKHGAINKHILDLKAEEQHQ